MFSTSVALTLLLSASLTSAAPFATPCANLRAACVANPKYKTDPFNVVACLVAAACFPGEAVYGVPAGPGGFLDYIGSSVTPLTAPRVNQATFEQELSTDGKVVSQQNFIDAYYRSESTTGPYPPSKDVIAIFALLQDWTQYCKTLGLPLKNFADYFQYSATVPSVGCDVPGGTLALSQEAACQMLINLCWSMTDSRANTIWSNAPCVLAASCVPGGTVVPLVNAIKGVQTTDTTWAAIEARVPDSILGIISNGASTITQQNWVDAWYSQLAYFGHYYVVTSEQNDFFISYYHTVAAWTAYCGPEGIPFSNVADFYQYSADVPSPGCP